MQPKWATRMPPGEYFAFDPSRNSLSWKQIDAADADPDVRAVYIPPASTPDDWQAQMKVLVHKGGKLADVEAAVLASERKACAAVEQQDVEQTTLNGYAGSDETLVCPGVAATHTFYSFTQGNDAVYETSLELRGKLLDAEGNPIKSPQAHSHRSKKEVGEVCEVTKTDTTCPIWYMDEKTGAVASFDCQKAGLSKIETTICSDNGLSDLDLQLDSVYAVARAVAEPDAKAALSKAQSDWLITRNRCTSVECLHSAYAARIAQLSVAPGVRGIDFALSQYTHEHDKTPLCPDILPRSILVPFILPLHLEATKLPKGFAKFVPFVPPDTQVLDLLCTDIKGDGSTTYLLVTREPNGFAGTLTLLSARADGSMQLEAENKTIIQTDAAGIEGGYGGIAVNPNGFSVMNAMGGGGDVNTYKFTFVYSQAERTWMLTNIDIEAYGPDNATDPEHHTTADLGKVTFSAFDATPYGIDTP